MLKQMVLVKCFQHSHASHALGVNVLVNMIT